VATRASAPLPEVWAPALSTAARSRSADLPDALDRAIAKTDLADRTPFWWRVIGGLQWLLVLAAAGGLGWLLVGYLLRLLALPELEYPKIGAVPLPTLLLLGGLVLGFLLWLLLKPLVDWGARRARRRVEQRLRSSITEVAREYVVAPVRDVLNAYAQAREALSTVRS
jgi:hypothetical protein